MALFFTATLLISILGLVSLIALKGWELRTGGALGGSLRPRVGRFSEDVLAWFEGSLPELVHRNALHLLELSKNSLHHGVAKAVVFTEGKLEHTLHVLRHTTEEKPRSGEVSAFLREVAEHKKQLLAQGPGAITEE